MDPYKSSFKIIQRSECSFEYNQSHSCDKKLHKTSDETLNLDTRTTLNDKAFDLNSSMQSEIRFVDPPEEGTVVINEQKTYTRKKGIFYAAGVSKKFPSSNLKFKRILNPIRHASNELKYDAKGFASCKEMNTPSKQRMNFSSVPKKSCSEVIKCPKGSVASKGNKYAIHQETAEAISPILKDTKHSTRSLVGGKKFVDVSICHPSDEKERAAPFLNASKNESVPYCPGKSSVKKSKAVKPFSKCNSNHSHSVRNRKNKSSHSGSHFQDHATNFTISVEDGSSPKGFQNTSVKSKEKAINILPHTSDFTSTVTDFESNMPPVKTSQKHQGIPFFYKRGNHNVKRKHVPSKTRSSKNGSKFMYRKREEYGKTIPDVDPLVKDSAKITSLNRAKNSDDETGKSSLHIFMNPQGRNADFVSLKDCVYQNSSVSSSILDKTPCSSKNICCSDAFLDISEDSTPIGVCSLSGPQIEQCNKSGFITLGIGTLKQDSITHNEKMPKSDAITTSYNSNRLRRSRIRPLKFWEGEHRTFKRLKNGDIILHSQIFS